MIITTHAVHRFIQRIHGKTIHQNEITDAWFTNVAREITALLNESEVVSKTKRVYNNITFILDGESVVTVYKKGQREKERP